jgi:hypothetical protein
LGEYLGLTGKVLSGSDVLYSFLWLKYLVLQE